MTEFGAVLLQVSCVFFSLVKFFALAAFTVPALLSPMTMSKRDWLAAALSFFFPFQLTSNKWMSFDGFWPEV